MSLLPMKHLAALSTAFALTGCAPMCAYLTGMHNQSAVTYRIRETNALIPAGGRLADINYKMAGSGPTEVLHLDPVRYHRATGEVFPLTTPQERAVAFNVWRMDNASQPGGYPDPDSWIRDWIGGTIVVQHAHSVSPWEGPSWTEMASNQQSNATAKVHAARLHLLLGISQDRSPWLRSEGGVCP